MMLVAPELKVVPVTIHIPLKEVMGALDEGRIVKTLLITARDLRAISAWRGRASPSPASTPMPERTAPWGARRSK